MSSRTPQSCKDEGSFFPYTVANTLLPSCSILGIMPLSALFVLFDFVVQNPHHADIRANLTFMDIASGHFSQLEHVSAGSLPGNHLSEFAHIARRYVQESPAPPPAAGPSTGQVTPSLGVTPADASLARIAAGDTVSIARGVCDWVNKLSGSFLIVRQTFQNHEMSSSMGGVAYMGNSINFDESSVFDDFAGTADFLSDVDVRALLSSSFLI